MSEQVAPETQGVAVQLLATVDLGPEIQGMEGRQGVPFGSPGAYSTSPISSMWMNGSRSRRSAPANARRTGKPSPSNPDGAVVMERTRRCTAVGASAGTRGRTVRSATVTAGMFDSLVHDSTTALNA